MAVVEGLLLDQIDPVAQLFEGVTPRQIHDYEGTNCVLTELRLQLREALALSRIAKPNSDKSPVIHLKDV